MNISPDGVTVRFKTEPESLFDVEKSGAKPNTVRIIDAYEADQIERKHPTKIIIQNEQESFLRTLTDIHLNYNVLGKVIAIFSWTNEEHHHQVSNETEQDPYAHTMSLVADDMKLPTHPHKHTMPQDWRSEEVDGFVSINLSKQMYNTLQNNFSGQTMNSVVQKLYETYLYKLAEERGSAP